MVDFEEVGVMITIIMVLAGSMFSLLPTAFGGETFGLPVSLYTGTIAYNNSKLTLLIDTFNENAEAAARSDPVNQTGFLAANIILVTGIIMGYIIAGLTNWIGIIEAIFIFDLDGTAFIRIPLTLLMGMIIFMTMFKFFGNVIKSLPFIGSG